MELTPILQKTLEIGGSDVFLIPGSPATAKVKGHMVGGYQKDDCRSLFDVA